MYATSPGGGRLLARIFGERPARPALSCPATRTSARPLLLSPTPNAFLRVSVLCASPPKILLPPSPPVFLHRCFAPLGPRLQRHPPISGRVSVPQIPSLSFSSSLRPGTDGVRGHVTKTVGGNAFGSTDERSRKDSSEMDVLMRLHTAATSSVSENPEDGLPVGNPIEVASDVFGAK